ncbi:NAD(P)-dependent oxidoreductase [Planctomonas sp. JC2975]|uniref:NAD(P)-dependent oxidoreductase n=1 Tax=Planctomonas sp. JC2975 TaxID=2729626 RepID=UPI00147566DE|nr:NAD(P)-dependent oxidoreductase [Planctomonas sp. JC2975]NNC13172.1 NAD(P)-dependent oxidoreductase [Planctomonas sp. JC2975]
MTTDAAAGVRRVGFLGTGLMGEPMARNLLAAGVPLAVWNRSRAPLDRLVADGAHPARTVADLFASCDVVLMMLSTGAVIDEVLSHGTEEFGRLVRRKTLVYMGTVSPAYSADLERSVREAGGRYVEAPVSGSAEPARNRELVGMLAGEPSAVDSVRPLVDLMCVSSTVCGLVPAALTMKLAVNVFLISVVTGLAEAFRFAEANGLDPNQLRSIVDAGQMSSPISRVKTAKLVSGDLSPQASISDVLKNCELVEASAMSAGVPVDLVSTSRSLFESAAARGDGRLDMVAVLGGLGDRR